MTRPPRPQMTTEKVQHWIVSLLILAVALFPSGALVAAVVSLRDDRHPDAIVLTVILAVLDVIAMTAARLVHRVSPWSPWLAVGLLPAVVVAFVVL